MLDHLRRWLLLSGVAVALACFALPWFSLTSVDGSARATGVQILLDRPQVNASGAFVADDSIGVTTPIAVLADEWRAPTTTAFVLLAIALGCGLGGHKRSRIAAWFLAAAAVTVLAGRYVNAILPFGPQTDLKVGVLGISVVIVAAATSASVLWLIDDFANARHHRRSVGVVLDRELPPG